MRRNARRYRHEVSHRRERQLATAPPSTAQHLDHWGLPLYRALFAVVAVVYPAWWPISVYGMGAVVDPIIERGLVGALGAIGWYVASRPRLHRYVPVMAEVVIYALPIQYFTLIVRNDLMATMQVGVFVTLAAIGLVPRPFGRTAVFAVVMSAVAAAACWRGRADHGTWVQLFGGVMTFELVALAITWRTTAMSSARELAEREALTARDAAENAARSKDDLLARVSHELRTPMNGVINMLDLVRDSPLSPTQRDHVDTAHGCARDMLALVNDLLDLSKVTAGRLTLSLAPFTVASLVERALRELMHRAAAKGVLLQIEVSPEVPNALMGDAQRLHQVLINLIDNAIKFTERGAIAVTIARAPRPAGDAHASIAISVADTGCGIAPDALERIFHAFEQADGTITRRFGGTGLGLTIASELVALMGGTLTVASEVGVGSTFSFDLTLPRASTTGALPAEAAGTAIATTEPTVEAPLRVLVAEDNRTNQQVVRLVLEGAGHTVHVADNGMAALAALGALEVDALLLDVQMPDLDGLEVARRVRAGAVPGRERVAIIAVTAQAVAGDRERCLAAGMDAYLSKPIDRAALLTTLRQVTAHQTARVAVSARSVVAIDHEDLVRRLGEDPAILGPALLAFSDASHELVVSIGRAVAARCAADLRRDTHSLKGALLTIGAGAAARAAAALETIAKSESWGTAGDALAVLEREIARVDAEIATRYRDVLGPARAESAA